MSLMRTCTSGIVFNGAKNFLSQCLSGGVRVVGVTRVKAAVAAEIGAVVEGGVGAGAAELEWKLGGAPWLYCLFWVRE